MDRIRVLAVAVLMLMFFAVPVLAAEKPIVPETVAGVQNVTAAETKTLIASGAKAYDVRPERAHVKGKIPGTELLWYDEKSPKVADFDPSLDNFALESLPADKDAELIFYCNGETCWKSYKASIVAVNAGYKNVKWFRGGLPEWKETGEEVVKP